MSKALAIREKELLLSNQILLELAAKLSRLGMGLPSPLFPLPNLTSPHPTSTTWSSKAPRPAGVAVRAPSCSDAPKGPLSLRGLGRKRRGRRGGGSRLRSARSGEGPADCAGECAPTGPPAQPLTGRFALGWLLPCSVPAVSANPFGSAELGLPRDTSRTPGPWELSWPRLCVPALGCS